MKYSTVSVTRRPRTHQVMHIHRRQVLQVQCYVTFTESAASSDVGCCRTFPLYLTLRHRRSVDILLTMQVEVSCSTSTHWLVVSLWVTIIKKIGSKKENTALVMYV